MSVLALFAVTRTRTRRTSAWTCCGTAIISPSPSSSPWWRSGRPSGRGPGAGPSCGYRDPWRSSPISWITSSTTWPGLRWLRGKVSGGKSPSCSMYEFETLRQLGTAQPSPLSGIRSITERMTGSPESRAAPDPGTWRGPLKRGRQGIARNNIAKTFQWIKIFCVINYKSFPSFALYMIWYWLSPRRNFQRAL